MALVIRNANDNDSESIYSLNTKALGVRYPKDQTKQRLHTVLQNKDAKILVAELDGTIAGYIHAADYDCTYADSLKNILALAVDERHRGKGIGRTLLSAMEDWARVTGAAGVRVISGMARAEAHRFYEACGYINRKNQKNFIKWF